MLKLLSLRSTVSVVHVLLPLRSLVTLLMVNGWFVYIHKDNRDVVSIILSSGNNVDGNDTVYYKDKEDTVEIGRTKFKHGQFQTGSFHEVYHGSVD